MRARFNLRGVFLAAGLLLCAETARSQAEATRLVEQTRAAQARWENFPGFAADLEVTVAGQTALGRVIVLADGQVHVESVPRRQRDWATAQLTPLVAEMRGAVSAPGTVWAFVGTPARAGHRVVRKDDPFGPTYRILDRQFVAVESRAQGRRITQHTLGYGLNGERHLLPAVVAVHARNVWSQALERTDTRWHTWTRLGNLDLPETLRVLTAEGRQEGATNSLKLTNHRLFSTSELVAERKECGVKP